MKYGDANGNDDNGDGVDGNEIYDDGIRNLMEMEWK